MGEFNELVKSVDKIREYTSEFYIYGYKTHSDYAGAGSLRSYDNEKRRIESYLGGYSFSKHGEEGKKVFITADNSELTDNPLYRIFKAKSFTKNDITLHFYLLDVLKDGGRTIAEIAAIISKNYSGYFQNPVYFDAATIRHKLHEYRDYGIVRSEKQGKKEVYFLCESKIDMDELEDLLPFFAQVFPMGVIGSYLCDRLDNKGEKIYYKHHYSLSAIDSEIVYTAINAAAERKAVEIINYNRNKNKQIKITLYPLRILVNVMTGRSYIAAVNETKTGLVNLRVDNIKRIAEKAEALEETEYADKCAELLRLLQSSWAVCHDTDGKPKKIVMDVRAGEDEYFILERLAREGGNGKTTKIAEDVYRYEIAVNNPMEVLPWIRTFTGRIVGLDSDDKCMVKLFYDDMSRLKKLYGGDDV